MVMLKDASVAIGTQSPATSTTTSAALGELSQSDLTNLVPSGNTTENGQIGDTDDIFKHLSDTTAIEIESILSEFNNTPYIKVSSPQTDLVTYRCRHQL